MPRLRLKHEISTVPRGSGSKLCPVIDVETPRLCTGPKSSRHLFVYVINRTAMSLAFFLSSH